MYGWRARIGNISPTACAEILPYEFYRVAPEGVTFVSTNLVIRDARESSQVEASWQKFDTAFEDLLHTRVDHITLSGAPLVLANGVERHRELLQEFRNRYPVPVGTSPQSFADALKYLGAVKLAVATSFIPAHNELVRAFLTAEGFDVLGIESLDTGMTSLEKALLCADASVSPCASGREKVFNLRCGADHLVGVADVDGDSSARRRSWQAGGEQLHGPDLVAAKGARDKSGHQGIRQTSWNAVLTEVVS